MIKVQPERQKLMSFIGLTDADLQLLKSKQAAFQLVVDKLVDELYAEIIRWPELVALIEKHSTIERLKETQRWYFLSMASGVIDEEYIKKRLFIGNVHSRIGLTTSWYLGTYLKYADLATFHFKQHLPDDWAQVLHSLSKMFNLDSQLVLEAYEHEEKQKIQTLADEQNKMLTTITSAVQDLASMMVELGGSSQTVADTAIQTAESQELSNTRIDELNNEIKDIAKMGSVMKEISDQTHLLGLNAAIEAARSGEHGRGFEVVANEVRKLASHSRESLDQIQSKLKLITQKLDLVKKGSEETTHYARTQAASAQELTSFVQMIENVTAELEKLKK
ncbi:heme-based aerotactic transducer HemAT [Paenibacillus marchantiophytorum]|uniref:Heme-based aerotactic transducer HemAT n=1 Tax=Paenibacillus marchantiophytorum TaxID=1619310 RepID=A0ABQ1EL45_9BACL|nr:globin-coupled sensor protein [Paenibacillus marchantiophytorum]GFZ76514.1 heme-based aerotactic transducer HemAT [Paenibacillus marchantiophytorum]